MLTITTPPGSSLTKQRMALNRSDEPKERPQEAPDQCGSTLRLHDVVEECRALSHSRDNGSLSALRWQPALML